MEELENTIEEAPRSLSIDEAVAALRDSREQPEPETATEEPEAEAEELPEEPTDDVEEIEEQPDDEAEEDAEPEEDALYEVEGETFTLSELQEWKKGALRQADYTKKTQELSRDREVLVKQRDDFEAEKQQVIDQLSQQQAQLQETLAMFAVEQAEKPVRANFRSTDEYLQAQDAYEATLERKQKAAETYQALTAHQQQQTAEREIARTLQYFPEWSTDAGWKAALSSMAEVAASYGYSAQEIQQGGIMDHRSLRVLNRLAELEQLVGDRKVKSAAQAKKVVKATKKIAPSGKPEERSVSKEVREARQRLKKTGSVNDAVAALQARRKANSA